MTSPPTSTRPSYFAWLVIVLVSAAMAAGAYYAKPINDDAQLWLMAREAPQEIAANYRDRALMGRGFQAAADTGWFWEIGIAACFLASILTAAATRGIWIRLLPEHAPLWPVAALLAVVPVFMELQCTLTPVYALQTAVVYLAVLIVWPAEGRPLSATAMAAAAISIALIGSITEYTVSSGAALITLLLAQAWRRDPATQRARAAAAAGIVIGVVGGYALYRATAVMEARPAMQLSENIDHFLRRVWTVPFKLAASLLQCFGGALAREIPRIDPVSKVGLVAIVGGLSAAWLARFDLRRYPSAPSTDDQADSRSPLRILPPLAVAIIAGLLPLLVMDRRPDDEGPASRYYIGVIPLAACGTVALVAGFTALRLRRTAMLGVVWLSAFAALNHAGRWYRESELLRSVGTALEPAVVGELTLIFVDLHRTPYQGFGNSYFDAELVARMTRDWPDERRKRIWIMPADYTESPERLDPLGHREVHRPQREGDPWRLSINCRGVRRSGVVSRVLWAVVFEDGSIRLTELSEVRPHDVK